MALLVVKTKKPSSQNWLKEGIYVLEVEVEGNPSEYQSFIFPVPPSSVTEDETFSVEFIPTQDRIYTEHQGILNYTIVISGTTGVLPTGTARLGVSLATPFGTPSFVADNTGYAKLHELRTLLRKYAELKTRYSPDDVKMYFTNTKDEAYYIVEPISFRVDRDARSPVLYRYSLSLRAKAPVDTRRPIRRPWWRKAWDTFNRVVNLINGIERIASELYTLIDETGLRILKVCAVAGNLARTISRFMGLYSEILRWGSRFEASFRAVKEAWQNLAGEQKQKIAERYGFNPEMSDVPPFPYTAKEVKTTMDTMVNVVREMMEQSIDLMLKYSAVIVSAHRLVSNLELLEGIGFFTQASQPFASFTEPELVEQVSGKSADEYRASYGNPPSFSAVRKVVVRSGDNIYSIAQRELGNWRYWKVIVELNRLRYPYVWWYSMPNVKGPGDELLIPELTMELPDTQLFYKKSISLSLEDVELGVDLFTAEGDLVISPRFDLAVAVGLTALKQAIIRRLSTPLGVLFQHPDYGVAGIGRKVVGAIPIIIRQLSSSVIADGRVEAIEGVNISVDGNVMKAQVGLRLKQIPDILSVEVVG